jgi:flavorubredoxin
MAGLSSEPPLDLTVDASPVGLELVADTLFALGATVPVDPMISWVPPTANGHVSLNCYMLVDGDAGALIDTSFPVIGETVVAQARAFSTLRTVTMLLTRIVEFDSLGNGELLDQILAIDTVHAHFLPAHWLYFRPRLPRTTAKGDYAWQLLSDQAEVPVGPRIRLVTLSTRVKLLATAWFFEPATGTLFTSDSFGHVLSTNSDQRVATRDDDQTTLEHVLAHMTQRFRWMDQAKTEPMRRYLASVFDHFDVQRIAPSYGRVLEGPDIVMRHAELMDRALRELGTPSS